MLKQVMALSILILITGYTVWADEVVPEAGETNWLDRSHSALVLRAQNAAIWFDNFFGDRHNEEDPATMRTRFTLGWRASQHNDNEAYIRVRVKAKLPNLKERFYLELTNEEIEDPSLPLESRHFEDADDTEDEYNAVLSWLKRSTSKEKVSARVGLRSGSNVYILGRYRHYYNLTKTVKLRLTPDLFIDSGYGAGTRLLSELHYLLHHPGLIRFSTIGQLTHRSEGVEWRSGLSYTYRLANNEAIVMGGYLSGKSDGDYDVDNYTLSIRLRKQFMRSYLFYEIEPFMNWPAEDGYRTDNGIALNIQMVIGD